MIARIRSVKPSVFVHGLLYDIGEATGFGALSYLGYIGLWCWTDREARFEWKPRELKLGTMPHYDVDYGLLLNAYANTGMIVKYAHAGRLYGWMPRFLDHQNVNGREADSTLPAPPVSAVTHYESLLLTANFHAFTRGSLLADPVVCEGAGQHRARKSFVYYMRHGAQVKIGCSTDPWQRLAQLRTARPRLQLVGIEPGSEVLERARHEQFKRSRITGDREWFRWSDEISDHILARCTAEMDPSANLPPITEFMVEAATPIEINDLTRASPDTLGREGNRREGNRREGRTDTSSYAQRAGVLNRSESHGPEKAGSALLGTSAPKTPESGSETILSAARGIVEPLADLQNTPESTGAGLVVVSDTTRNVPALPAVRGERTATAVQERMASVLLEVQNGQRSRMKAEQLAKLNAELVFCFWTARFDHPKAILDSKREARIVARLKENGGDVSELLYALDGAAHDPHIMGTESGRKFDGIETVLRDRGQVEKFAGTRKGYRDNAPHKALAKLEAALRGDETSSLTPEATG